MTVRARLLPSPPRASVLGQFARFVAVGGSNTALSFATYVLAQGAGVPYLLAGALAFTAGAINGFVLNRRWTFRTNGSKLRYLAVQVAGLLLTTGLLRLFVEGAGLGTIAAYGLAIPAVTVTTFTANRAWTFG